jgi:hypothetical protein
MHVQHTMEYAKAAKAGDRMGMLQHLLDLLRGLGVWGQILKKKMGSDVNGMLAQGLMAEHIIGAKLLSDRQPADDQTAVGIALQLVARNADAQAIFLGAAIEGFPATDFRKLFGAHLEATANYIKDIASSDEASFNGHFAAAKKNAMDLDQFTAKTLLNPA